MGMGMGDPTGDRPRKATTRTTMIIISLLDSLWKFICVLE